MKKILSILLVVLLITALPISGLEFKASADETEGYYTYSVSGGKATINKVDTSISGDVTIPSTLGGYTVTGIDMKAFVSCSNLTSISIGADVTNIRTVGLFTDCGNLTSIEIAASNTNYSSENGVLFNKNKTQLIKCPQGKSSASYTIPDSVTNINNSAFWGCSKIANVIIPNSVTNIGSYAFDGCSSLTSVTIPDSVTSIGNLAFRCNNLESIIIGDGVTSIGKNAFLDTGYYKNSNNWVEDVLYIGNYLIEVKASKSNSYVIKEGTVLLANCAFDSCKKITSVTIPKSVKVINASAFKDCSGLTTVYYRGSSKDKSNISIGSNTYLTEAEWYYDSCIGSAEHTYGDDETCDVCGYKEYVLGDINNDDTVTLTDVVTLAQYVAEWDVVCNEKALDVNGDGDVTLTDVVHLAQYVAEWEGVELH